MADCGSCTSLAPHHASQQQCQPASLPLQSNPSSAAAAAASPLPTQQQPNPLEEPATRTPGCRGKRAPLPTSSPGNPQLRTLAWQHLKAPTFPQRTEEKRRNEHGLIQEAGFWAAADGANARRNRGGTPELSSSDQGAARQPYLHEHRPRARRTKTAAATHQNRHKSPIAHTRGALRTSHAPQTPRRLRQRRRWRWRRESPLCASTGTRRRAQGTSGRVGRARSRPAPSPGWPPIRRRRPNRAARPAGGSGGSGRRRLGGG